MKISKELRKFLKEWLAWAEDGAPEHPMFIPSTGLCDNLCRWNESFDSHLICELEKLFGDEEYPFGEIEIYNKESDNRSMHKNPMRLAWVRKTLSVRAKPKSLKKAAVKKVIKAAFKEAGKRKDTPTARRIAAAKRGAK